MEFHISRLVREKLDIDGLLFSYTGNAIFANVAASRKLASRLNALRGADADPAKAVNAGALFAMGMIDELNHALVARYREEIDPDVLSDALRWFGEKIGEARLDELLLAFVEQFPNVSVFQGKETAAQWLAGTTEGLPNREAALEELMLLWLTNVNPAFVSFRELFDDTGLQGTTQYPSVTAAFPDYLNSRPLIAPEIGSLFDALSAPMLAAPDSITAQLEFIRGQWPKFLGEDLGRVLLAIDTLREEDIAIWMRFHPPGAERFSHTAPGWGGEGFVGDEYVGFDQDFIVGPDGVRQRRYSTDYQAPLNEYEAFSADLAWMPNVVLIAKSTYVWLEQLSKKYGRYIQYLNHIPDEEFRLLADRGITGLWLIGLWERSVASKTIKRLRGHADAVASAYSLKEYNIAEDLGGGSAYAHLRDRAAAHGIRLASDMVPNHMGIDSPWVIEHPDWFISKRESPFPVYQFEGPDISPDPRVEIKIEDHYYDQTDAAVVFRLRHHADGVTRFVYHGNDGTSFAWNDTAQLDYSKHHVREHVIQTILHVARQFPIIRFDAAMVLAKRHVQRLWFPLPGAGGSIPSRAEDAVSQEEFDALMPHEFWREVVDRVAVEVPGTLLLAEAFWLLEGYFVRTLGMHRVYNSAFMNMLRDEENAKYRSYLKKTIEFDPDILKRYVNFMSNPDERTAIDQFGSGDKYFGVATLLSTLPGLPMFGHGQIEGYTERYGMEFKQAKMDEYPNEGLEARHQHLIAPLLKNRQIFAESTNFLLFDFWTGHGTVDENVFAYSNRMHGQRAVIFYNNRYEGTRGSIHVSAGSMDKGSGSLRHTGLSEGLAVPFDGSMVVAYRDIVSGLEYLRRSTDLHHHGMTVDLRGYQSIVLLHWRELRSTAEQPWDRLCDALGGRGVRSVDEALSMLRMRPLHEALHEAISAGNMQLFAILSEELSAHGAVISDISEEAEPLDALSIAEAPEEAAWENAEPDSEIDAELEEIVADDAIFVRLGSFLEQSLRCFERVMDSSSAEIDEALKLESDALVKDKDEIDAPATAVQPALTEPEDVLSTSGPSGSTELYREACEALSLAAVRLPVLEKDVLPAEQPTSLLLTWVILRSIPAPGIRAALFDKLQLRPALAEIFSSLGVASGKIWRMAALIRVLLLLADASADFATTKEFWHDADVRWLAGVNESAGKTYLNKEQFEELLWAIQMPALLEIAGQSAGQSSEQAESIKDIEDDVSKAALAAKEAGYELDKYLKLIHGETVAKPAIGIAEVSPALLTETAPKS
jgi:glycosidase